MEKPKQPQPKTVATPPVDKMVKSGATTRKGGAL